MYVIANVYNVYVLNEPWKRWESLDYGYNLDYTHIYFYIIKIIYFKFVFVYFDNFYNKNAIQVWVC